MTKKLHLPLLDRSQRGAWKHDKPPQKHPWLFYLCTQFESFSVCRTTYAFVFAVHVGTHCTAHRSVADHPIQPSVSIHVKKTMGAELHRDALHCLQNLPGHPTWSRSSLHPSLWSHFPLRFMQVSTGHLDGWVLAQLRPTLLRLYRSVALLAGQVSMWSQLHTLLRCRVRYISQP